MAHAPLGGSLLEEVSGLRTTVRTLRLMLANLPDIQVAIYSIEGTLVLLAGLQGISGVTASEGMHYEDFLPPERRDRFLRMFNRAKFGLETLQDYPIGDREFEILSKPIFDERQIVQYVMIQVRDVSAARAALRAVETRGGRDSLTGLPKRKVLEAHVNSLLKTGAGFSVLFIDLDKFKQVNDTMGHKAGDLLLEKVSNRLQGSIRQGDLAVRLGGDEFVAVLVGEERVDTVADRILKNLREVTEPYGSSASVGMAKFPEDGISLQALLEAADAGMYRAKIMGGDALRPPESGPRLVEVAG